MANLLEKAKEFVADKMGNIKKPEGSVTDVDLGDISLHCITYNAKISVHNPYSHSIPIGQISYTLKCAARVIATGTMPDPGSLKAHDTTMLNVPLKVANDVLVTLAKDIGADWDIDYELDLGLTIDLPIIGEFTLPLSSKGQIKLPTLSDLWSNKE